MMACSAPAEDSEVTGLQGRLTTAVYRINSGGGAVGAFSADQYASGGHTWSDGSVSTAGVANAAPAAVYQSERYGNFAYTFPGLTPGARYVTRLHFAETKWNRAGARVFNVSVNGAPVLSNFDIFASAGLNKALVRDFDVTASSGGQITVQYSTVTDNAKSSAIEILSNSEAEPSQVTTVNVTPSSAGVMVNGSQQFSASAYDQSGAPMTATFAWAVSGGGTINSSGLFSATTAGTFTVTATSGGVTGSATITVSAGAGAPPAGAANAVYRINCGGGAVSPFSADQFASGGSAWDDNVVVATAGVANAAPAAVYRTERYGNHSYTFGGLTAGASYVARLHFAETKWTTAGSRVFHVSINGTRVLNNFDIYARAGINKALVVDVNAVASGSGQLVIQYQTVVDNARSSGIEIWSDAPTTPGNQPPTVASAASANPNPTTGASAALSVLGADDGGQAALTYTWATTGNPPAAVSFSANGNNAAKNTTASFSKAGSYTLAATIRDASGATATSSVNVVVNQRTTSISVTPSSAQVAAGGSQQFLASAKDQFGAAMSPQPAISWSVSGGGAINSVGQFSAGNTAGGPFTVSATGASTVGNASVSVTSGGGGSTYSTSFDIAQSPISESGRWKQDGLDWTRVVTANGYAFGTQSGNGGFDDSYAYLSGDFAANQTATAIIHLEPGISTTYAEVEILLRWRDSAHYSTGYECNLAYNGQYAEIIQWPGPRGTHTSQFKFITVGNPVAGGVHDGDVFQADVIGNVITARLNGNVIARGVDDSIPSGGAPGIGFYWQGGAASQKFSFSQFSGGSL
jgi:beta-galactosidase